MFDIKGYGLFFILEISFNINKLISGFNDLIIVKL